MGLRARGWNKFRAKKAEVGEEKFDSKLEARRWIELKTLERVGVISGLRRQVPFDLTVNGHQVCRYIADFVYTTTATAEPTVEDAKGMLTPEFKLKARLMEALHGIVVHVWTGSQRRDQDVNRGRWVLGTRRPSYRTTSKAGAGSRSTS